MFQKKGGQVTALAVIDEFQEPKIIVLQKRHSHKSVEHTKNILVKLYLKLNKYLSSVQLHNPYCVEPLHAELALKAYVPFFQYRTSV